MREGRERTIGHDTLQSDLEHNPELAAKFAKYAEFRELSKDPEFRKLSGGTAADVWRAMRKEHLLKDLAKELSSRERATEAYYASGELEIDTRKARGFIAKHVIRALLLSPHSTDNNVLSPLQFVFHLPWEDVKPAELNADASLGIPDAQVIITNEAFKEVIRPGGLLTRFSWPESHTDTVRGFKVPGDERLYTVTELLAPNGPLKSVHIPKEVANDEINGHFTREDDEQKLALTRYNYGAKLEALLRDKEEMSSIALNSLSGKPEVTAKVGAREATPTFREAYERAKGEYTTNDYDVGRQLAKFYCQELIESGETGDIPTRAILKVQKLLKQRIERHETLIERNAPKRVLRENAELIKEAKYLKEILHRFQDELRERLPKPE